jgi:hypothetical protein
MAQMPNPQVTPVTTPDGKMRPEWVRYFTLLQARVNALPPAPPAPPPPP